MMKSLKLMALMNCKISDVHKLDDNELEKCNKTIKSWLMNTDDGLGKELKRQKNHTCRLKKYEIKNAYPGATRKIELGTQCWCFCENFEIGGDCQCRCGMIFDVMLERAEKEAQTKIIARMLDHLTIAEVSMIPDLTKGMASDTVTIKEALEGLYFPSLSFVDRIIGY